MNNSGNSGSASQRWRVVLPATAVGVTVLVAVGLFCWNRGTAAGAELDRLVHPGDAAGLNLLLVTLDTTRADRLGCYGYERALTPTIDALLDHGVLIEHAVTSVPLTLPSHATLLTGLYPPQHGARNNGTYHVADEHTTLAETLSRHGYDTAAFVSAFVLDERFGLAQGFSVYEFDTGTETSETHGGLLVDRPADSVTDAALAWLASRQDAGTTTPFFLWVHYFDPHLPYEAPPEYMRAAEGRPYDAEVAFMDAQFKRLLVDLDRRGLRERTLIAVASDHGEGLGDHEEETHGMLLYESTLRVACILSCPKLFDGAYRVDGRVVGLVDIRPTLEDLLGIPRTQPCDGESLVRPTNDEDRAVYIETLEPSHKAGWSPLYGLRRLRDKYVLAPQPEYFDLLRDPNEQRNLCSSSPEAVAPLERQLADLMERWQSQAPTGAERTVTADEINRLAALGYVSGSEAPSSGEELPDPKAMMPFLNRLNRGLALFEMGRYDDVLPLAREVAEQCPDYVLAQHLLARTYVALGRAPEAVSLLREFSLRRPNFETYIRLAQTLLNMGRYAELDEVLDRAEALQPLDGKLPMLRAQALARQGLLDEAIAEYEQAIERDAARYGPAARRGISDLQRRKAAHRAP